MSKKITVSKAIGEALHEEMLRDEKVFIMGEDMAVMGNVFAITKGFLEEFGPNRVIDTPISEEGFVGMAVGAAMRGLRPVVELMYDDFATECADPLFNQAAKIRYMTGGQVKVPVVFRAPMGAGRRNAGQHSQCLEALFTHIPGLKVCFPATPWEAKGLMESALNGTDPVIFFESQRIYDVGEQFHEGGVPVEEYEWQPGAVNKVRDGKDLTILTIGATLYRALDAAKELSEKYGMEADVINMPSLVPLDYTDIIASVKKTGRVILASDACARGSFLNDVAQNISNLCFDYLDAPPVVVGAKNWITPPYEFDEFFFPQAEWIVDAVNAKIVPLNGYVSKITPTEAQFLKNAKAGV